MGGERDAEHEAQQGPDHADAGPLSMKMRSTTPRVAPAVRRMAMSRVLSFTSMIMLAMTLKVATRMMGDRMMNMTCARPARCRNRPNSLLPVIDPVGAAELPLHGIRDGARLIGIGDERLRRRHQLGELEVGCAVGSSMKMTLLSVLVNPDIEKRADAIRLDPRHAAEGGRLAVGRERRKRVGLHAESEGELVAQHHRVVGELVGQADLPRYPSRPLQPADLQKWVLAV